MSFFRKKTSVKTIEPEVEISRPTGFTKVVSGKVGLDGKYEGMDELMKSAEQAKGRKSVTYDKLKAMEAYSNTTPIITDPVALKRSSVSGAVTKAQELRKSQDARKSGKFANITMKTLPKERSKEISAIMGREFTLWIDLVASNDSGNVYLKYNAEPGRPHNDIGFESVGIPFVIEALAFNSNAKTLDLSDNDLTPVNMDLFGKFLSLNKTITELNLSNNYIGKGALYVFDALAGNSALVSLNLAANSITPDDITSLDVLKSNTTLKRLNLSRNMIKFSGCEVLVNYLKVNNGITHLNIEKNDVGYYGAFCIAEYARDNKCLVYLNISNNDIGDKGAKYLAMALRSNTTMVEVDLHGNNVNERGLSHWFRKKKRFSPALEKVDLSENPLKDPKTIYSVIKYNPNLKELNLSYVELGKEGVEAILSEIQKKSLKMIVNLHGNGYRFPQEGDEEETNGENIVQNEENTVVEPENAQPQPEEIKEAVTKE